jgi:acyl-CoA reductase-like NAD-dependent aldehyde dehydrogenase
MRVFDLTQDYDRQMVMGERVVFEADAKAIEDENVRLRTALDLSQSTSQKMIEPMKKMADEIDRLNAELAAKCEDCLYLKSSAVAVERVAELAAELAEARKALELIYQDTSNRPGHEKWEYYCKRLHGVLMISNAALKAGKEGEK